MNPNLAPQFIVPDWPAPTGVRAAVSMRMGGVSLPPFSSLNVGWSTGDTPASVSENRRRIHHALDLPSAPHWILQVHGSRVVQVPQAPGNSQADASFTWRAGVVCVVQAADCLPVLFCDDAGSVVAAAHAGWRGLAAGVLEATVAAMGVAPVQLMAWMGPAIGPEAFEVGGEVREVFVAADAKAAQAFAARGDGKYLANLFLLAEQRLERCGVQRVYGGGLSTHQDTERFFSHRRDRISGRMAALIWKV